MNVKSFTKLFLLGMHPCRESTPAMAQTSRLSHGRAQRSAHRLPGEPALLADGKPGPCYDHAGAKADQRRFIRAPVTAPNRGENIVGCNTWQESPVHNVQIARVLRGRAQAIRAADPLGRPVFAHKAGFRLSPPISGAVYDQS